MAMTDDPDFINDADRQLEARIFKTGEEYAASNKRQKAENKARAENRNKIKEMGISTHAYQIAVKVVKDLTPGERADWIRDFQMVVKVLGKRQKELFPEEALKAEQRAKRQAEKAAGKPRSQAELDAETDSNPRSNPAAGGAQIDLEDAIAATTAAEQAEGEAVLEGKSNAWRAGYNAHSAGSAMADNPYIEGSGEARDWIGGFNEANRILFAKAQPPAPPAEEDTSATKDTEPPRPDDVTVPDGQTFNAGVGKPAAPVKAAKKSQSAKAAEKKAKAGVP